MTIALTPLISLIAGILILLMPRLLNYIVAVYLICVGLLGLLGTVFGMIEMFLDILTAGVGDANRLAGGIGQALISTAAGLCVAIPAVIFHRYLRGRITEYVVEMEQQATALLDALEEEPSASPGKPPRATKRGKA